MIYGISGKRNSGKDTVCQIMQYLKFTKSSVVKWTYQEFVDNFCKPKAIVSADHVSGFIHKKFATKVKEIICILLNCSIEDLEDREFKEKELGQEWWYFKRKIEFALYSKSNDCLKWPYIQFANELSCNKYYILVKPTVRQLMQLVGTDAGANFIHPNMWVNALFNEYIPEPGVKYPNWIITDVRYKGMPGIFNDPYEIEKIQSYPDSVLIRVERPGFDSGDNHRSEIALDDSLNLFNHVIINDGSIDDLITKIEAII